MRRLQAPFQQGKCKVGGGAKLTFCISAPPAAPFLSPGLVFPHSVRSIGQLRLPPFPLSVPLIK